MLQKIDNTLFRQQAIDSLTIAEDNIESLTIIKSSAWLWAIATFLILISIMLWAIYGEIPLSIETQGLILTDKQLQDIEQEISKNIADKRENSNDLYDLYIKKQALYSKHYITRAELHLAKEEYLAANNLLNEIKNNFSVTMVTSLKQPSRDSSLVLLAFIDYRKGKHISPDMPVLVLPTTRSIYHSGYERAVVTSISSFPISKQLADAYLRNSSLAEAYFYNGAPYLMKAHFIDTKESMHDIEPGSAFTAKVVYKTCAPIWLLSKTNKC